MRDVETYESRKKREEPKKDDKIIAPFVIEKAETEKTPNPQPEPEKKPNLSQLNREYRSKKNERAKLWYKNNKERVKARLKAKKTSIAAGDADVVEKPGTSTPQSAANDAPA